MVTNQIRFDDGAAYERYMGKWSQLAGEAFLDWLAPTPGLRWLDVGCGNGAFTEMLVERCAPASVDGIDPSEAQLAYARTRLAPRVAEFRQGDAMALPFPDDTFDAAVMPLVIFFVPDPAVGVAEMARVVRPGGAVTAYAWDMPGGGFPYDALQVEMRGLGLMVPAPPSPDASRLDAMRDLWTAAELDVRRHAGHHGATDVRGFRRLLDDHPRGSEHRLSAGRDGVRGSRRSQSAHAPAPAGRCCRPYHLQRTRQRRERSRASQMNRAIIAARCH